LLSKLTVIKEGATLLHSPVLLIVRFPQAAGAWVRRSGLTAILLSWRSGYQATAVSC
jgi:hypothetical protein